MTLSRGTLAKLGDQAKLAGIETLMEDTDLFRFGVLDSFSLVEFVSELENEYGIRVPDSDVEPAKFATIDTIERYIAGQIDQK